MSKHDLNSTVAVARALGHPARLRTVAILRSGELCVCQITEVLGLAPSTVSAHLKELKRAGLVSERKDGRWIYFSLATDQQSVSWIETAVAPLADDPRLLSDERLVEELRGMPVEDLCRLGYEAAKARASSSGEKTVQLPRQGIP